MPSEKLVPDPESVEKWAQLPQNKPSPSAMTPMMGGLRPILWLLVLILIVIILSALAGRFS